MRTVVVADDSPRHAEWCRTILSREGWHVVISKTASDAHDVLSGPGASDLMAAVILWEIAGPPFASDLLALCKESLPGLPVIVVSGALDAALAARAQALGASDFLQKPVDSDRLKSALMKLIEPADGELPYVAALRQRVLGESAAVVQLLARVARLVADSDLRVLLIGESGTGKELLARAIHELGPRAGAPWVPVNLSEIPATLVESVLFGHERGAFTGAHERHAGHLETAGKGTLFLDEVGDLEPSLQAKLLRVLQERQFRRIKGAQSLSFEARLVSATNSDLPAAVQKGLFRRDLFHRIAEATVEVPPLRKRGNDRDLLLRHFLEKYRKTANVRFARETLTILHTYPFRGNVRELDNVVRAAVVDSDGDLILPRHLPLQSMATFLSEEEMPAGSNRSPAPPSSTNERIPPALLLELQRSLPVDWLEHGYRSAVDSNTRAFDRFYLPWILRRSRHRIKEAAAAAGVDVKTFRKRWRECGLPAADAIESG